jgi:hypothetical protein
MKALRTLLSATALVLVAGAATAAPSDGITLGTENADSAVTQAYFPGSYYPKCFWKFGPHYHYFHGFHFGWHKKCFYGYPQYPGYPYYYKKNKP